MAEKTQLKPNVIGSVDDPVNITILDVPPFIHLNGCGQVTSTLTMEPSTQTYHPEGLFSEEIFGNIGSPERMTRFGYIELNTHVLHPKIFNIVVQLGTLYKDIMSGSAYALWDSVAKNFERVVGDPHDHPDASTGYSFFMHYFREIEFKTSESSKRDERIDVVKQYQDVGIYSQYLVEPAGLRDISNDSSGRLIQDDINKLYASLIMYTRSIPKGSNSVLYDSVRYQIQSKCQEIYEYIENFLDGKRGFIQGSFARRKVAMGTRNVITAAAYIAKSPTDPQLLRADDVMVGIYQTIKGLQPLTRHYMRQIFINPILGTEATSRIALTDPSTLKLRYTEIDPSTWELWTSSEGLDKMINVYRNPDIRSKPITIKGSDGKPNFLCLVYDDGDRMALCRSIDDLRNGWEGPIISSKLRAMTWIEFFYMVAAVASDGRCGFMTRYPVIEQTSTYPCRIHVTSTTPPRTVELHDLLNPGLPPHTFSDYPTIGASSMDAMMVHPSKLGGLQGDHDGDKCSLEYVWGDDANETIMRYLDSPRSVIDTQMSFITGAPTYLVDLCLHNMTY